MTVRISDNKPKPPNSKRRTFGVLSPSGIGGAMFGGVMGSVLGPIGAAAGLVVGGLAGEAVDRHYSQEREPVASKTDS